VCELYLNLARESGIESLVHVVGNKVADSEDLGYIRRRLSKEPVGTVPVLTELKRARQQGLPVNERMLTVEMKTMMHQIARRAQSPAIAPTRRTAMLHQLHRKLSDKKWVQLGYGDVSGQIYPEFDVHAANENQFQPNARLFA
jgi:CO dehydrogenase maturation factor